MLGIEIYHCEVYVYLAAQMVLEVVSGGFRVFESLARLKVFVQLLQGFFDTVNGVL